MVDISVSHLKQNLLQIYFELLLLRTHSSQNQVINYWCVTCGWFSVGYPFSVQNRLEDEGRERNWHWSNRLHPFSCISYVLWRELVCPCSNKGGSYSSNSFLFRYIQACSTSIIGPLSYFSISFFYRYYVLWSLLWRIVCLYSTPNGSAMLHMSGIICPQLLCGTSQCKN